MANKPHDTKPGSSTPSPTSEPVGEAQSAEAGGNRPASLRYTAKDKDDNIVGESDSHLTAYDFVCRGYKVWDNKQNKQYHGGKAAGGEPKKKGVAQFNVMTIVALVAMFCLAFGTLGALARAQEMSTPKSAIVDAAFKIKEGETLKVPAGNYRFKQPLKLPSRSTLDLTGSQIFFVGRDWEPAIYVGGSSEAKLIGGTFNVGKLNFVVDAPGADGFEMRGVHLRDGGGLIQGRSVRNILVEDCVADVVERNFIYFGDTPNDRITLRRVRLVEGSRAESGIRIHRTTNLLIEDCDVRATINKKSALRMHDGANITIKNTRFTGGVGVGPLTDGDGGRRLGIDQWIGGAGGAKDVAATAVARRDKLALRALNVRFVDCVVDGSLVAKAGGEFEFFGGSITPPGKQRIFEDTSERYPELDEWTLPGDLIRPAPVGKLIDVKLPSAVALNLPKRVTLGTNKHFEIWLAHYNFQTSGARQPLDFLWSYPRPVWLNEASGLYGFWTMSRWGDLGPGISDRAALSAAWTFAQSDPAPVIIDLEEWWPAGPAIAPETQPWWYGGVGSVVEPKLVISAELSKQAARYIDGVNAARPTKSIPVGAYVPNSIWDNGGPAFQRVVVDAFIAPLVDKIDFLVIDIYPHPGDDTPAKFEARARKVLAAYKPLGKPFRAIYWYSSPVTQFAQDDYLRAAKNAAVAEGAEGLIIWDDPHTPWTAAMTYDFESIRN